MTEFLSCLQSSDLVVREAVFDHRGGRYIGKGWIRWNPDAGAKIDLVVDRTGPPLPRKLGFGYVGWLRPEHYTTIRMKVDGFDWVIAPHVGLVDRMDVDGRVLSFRDRSPCCLAARATLFEAQVFGTRHTCPS